MDKIKFLAGQDNLKALMSCNSPYFEWTKDEPSHYVQFQVVPGQRWVHGLYCSPLERVAESKTDVDAARWMSVPSCRYLFEVVVLG